MSLELLVLPTMERIDEIKGTQQFLNYYIGSTND